LVIEKLFTVAVVLTVAVKKGAGFVPSSFLAFTTILTPLGGIVEVIVTTKSKGPFDAGWVELRGGLVVNCISASGVPPPPPPLPFYTRRKLE
jgi:hypothetical protein